MVNSGQDKSIIQKLSKNVKTIVKNIQYHNILLTTKQEDFITSCLAEILNSNVSENNCCWFTQFSSKHTEPEITRADLVCIEKNDNGNYKINCRVEAKYLYNFDFSDQDKWAQEEILRAYCQLLKKNKIPNNVILLYIIHFDKKSCEILYNLAKSNPLFNKIPYFTYLRKNRLKKYIDRTSKQKSKGGTKVSIKQNNYDIFNLTDDDFKGYKLFLQEVLQENHGININKEQIAASLSKDLNIDHIGCEDIKNLIEDLKFHFCCIAAKI